jgi:hypothetical protein
MLYPSEAPRKFLERILAPPTRAYLAYLLIEPRMARRAVRYRTPGSAGGARPEGVQRSQACCKAWAEDLTKLDIAGAEHLAYAAGG